MRLCLAWLLGLAAATRNEKSVAAELRQAFEKLLELEAARKDPCALERSAIITDKPVYRPGETVFASVYNYSVLDKRPSKCAQHRNPTLHLFDALNGFIAAFEPAGSFGSLGQSFNLTLAAELPAGLYRLRQPLSGDESALYVLRFSPNRAALVAEWNRQTAHVGDTLSTRLCLRTLGQAPLALDAISYAFHSDFTPLLSETQRAIDSCVKVSFKISRHFTRSVVFLATARLAGATLSYKKEFFEPELSNMSIDFAFETGKPFAGLNTVYFRAWAGRKLQLEAVVVAARVLRVLGDKEQVLVERTASEDEGRGRFELSLVPEDFGAGHTYLFEAQFDTNVKHRFLFVYGKRLTRSPVGMRVLDRVVSPGRPLRVSFVGSAEVTLVLQDKGVLLFASDVKAEDGSTFDVPLRDLPEAARGGVFTLQLFTRVAGVPEAQQEMEVFVEPRGYIGARVAMPLRVSAGQLLEFGLELSSTCSRCTSLKGSEVFGLLDVLDDSAAAEVPRALHAAPLVTKVFLQSEVHSRERLFFDGKKYIERLFVAESRMMSADFAPRIRLLLGVQGHRRFLFTPQRLAAYLAGPERLEVFDYRHSFLNIIPLSAGLFEKAGKVLVEGFRPALMGMSLNGGAPRPQPSAAPDHPFLAAPPTDPDVALHVGFFAAKDGLKWAVRLPNRAGEFVIRGTLFSDTGFYGNIEQSFKLQKQLALSADVPPSLFLGEMLTLSVVIANDGLSDLELLLPKPVTLASRATLADTLKVESAKLPHTYKVSEKTSGITAELRVATALLEPGLRHRAAAAALLAPGAAELKLSPMLAGSDWLEAQARVCAKTTALHVLLDALRKLEADNSGRAEVEAVHVVLTAAALRALNATHVKEAEQQQRQTMVSLHTGRLRDRLTLLLGYRNRDWGFRAYADPDGPSRAPISALALWALRDSGLGSAEMMAEVEKLLGSPSPPASKEVDVPALIDSPVFSAFVLARGGGGKAVPAPLLAAVEAVRAKTPSPAALALLALLSAQLGEKEKGQAAVKAFPPAGDPLPLAVRALLALADLRVQGQSAHLPELLSGLHSSSPSLQALLWGTLALAELFPPAPQARGDLTLALQAEGLPATRLVVKDSDLIPPCTPQAKLPDQKRGKGASPSLHAKPEKPFPHPALLVFEVLGTVAQPPAAAVPPVLVRALMSDRGQLRRYDIQLRNALKRPLGQLVYEVQRPSCFVFNVGELETMKLAEAALRYELRQADSVLRLYLPGLPVSEDMQFGFSMERRYAVTPCTERPHLLFEAGARAETLTLVEPKPAAP